ncbi:MAG: hypothetical protein WC464_04270 [Bdellovibrionales bacterium]
MRNVLALAMAVLGIAFATPSSAATVFYDDFTNPWGGSGFTTYAGGSTMGAWTVTGAGVDLIGNYWQAPNNPTGYPINNNAGSVDLSDGTVAGGIYQYITLNPGEYVLSFSLSGNPDGPPVVKEMEAVAETTIGDYEYAIKYPSGAPYNSKDDMKYVDISLVFTVSGIGPQSVLLQFLSLDDTAYGAVIGNVAINTIPLPAALGLFAPAVLGFGGYRFFRRRRSV